MGDIDAIIDLVAQLVRMPTRTGVDDCAPVIGVTERWLRERRVTSRVLRVGRQPVALVVVVAGRADAAAQAPVYMLNATLDTAGFGDESRWRDLPTSACVRDGWMYGRGSADSKVGAAIFCQLVAHFVAARRALRGTLVLLLDLDEHSGGFAGVRRYFEQHAGLPRPDGVFIGYPGNDHLVVGSRGFTRACIEVRGEAAHSGGSRRRGINAVIRAAQLIVELDAAHLAHAEAALQSATFPLPPQLTVTAVDGGEGYSSVPDLCRVLVDIRLTPRFTRSAAMRALRALVQRFDRESAACPVTRIEWQRGWPAYRISDAHPMVRALRRAAEREFQRVVTPAVVGPSNIGNHLKTLKIPTLAGFGVTYRGVHAQDECIELASIAPVYRSYLAALTDLLCAG